MMKKFFTPSTLFALSVCASILPFSVYAESDDVDLDDLLNMDIEELLNTSFVSGFFSEKLSLSPGTQYTLDFEDIDAYGTARTVGEALNSYGRGITVSNHVEYGNQIGVRGILVDNNAKTPVMWDGQLLSQRAHFGYATALATPLIGDMRAAEVSLSPNTIVLGGGAINGYINMVPKNGTDNAGWYTNVEYGFIEKSKAVQVGNGFSYGKGKDLYLYAGIVDASGFTPNSLLGETLSNTTDYAVSAGRVRGYGDATYRVSSYWRHNNFTMSTILNKTTPQNNSIGDGPSDGVWFNHDYFDQTFFANSMKYTHHINDDQSVDFRLVGEMYDYGGKGVQSFRTTAFPQVHEGGSESHIEGKAVYKNTAVENHSIAAGVSYGIRNFNDQAKFFDSNSLSPRESIDFDMTEISLFAEDKYQINDSWMMVLGLRYDSIDYGRLTDGLIEGLGAGSVSRDLDGEENVAPRIGFAWQANETMDVTFGYQEGFRTPDAKFLARDIQWDQVNPAAGITLKPETVDNYQIDIEKRFPEQKLTTNVSLFMNEYHDLIRWNDFSNTGLDQHGISGAFITQMFNQIGWFGQFVNAQKDFKTVGGELYAAWEPNDDWTISGSYGYAQLLDEPSTNWERVAQHHIKMHIRRYLLDKKLALDWNAVWNSSFDVSRLNVQPQFDDYRLVMDAALTYKIQDNIMLKGTVQNIFENDVPVMNERPDSLKNGVLGIDERLFYLSLKATF